MPAMTAAYKPCPKAKVQLLPREAPHGSARAPVGYEARRLGSGPRMGYGLDDGIGGRAADLADAVVAAVRVDAVAEEGEVDVAIRVDPERRPREAQVAERAPGEQVARGRSSRRGVPAEG